MSKKEIYGYLGIAGNKKKQYDYEDNQREFQKRQTNRKIISSHCYLLIGLLVIFCYFLFFDKLSFNIFILILVAGLSTIFLLFISLVYSEIKILEDKINFLEEDLMEEDEKTDKK